MTQPERARTRRFFILGCQRSGTTLLRLVLESHPDVACHDETTAYDILRGDRRRPGGADGGRATGFKIPRWTEQLARPSIPAEPGMEGTEGFYREEPVLFMVRDVRDTIVSMLHLPASRSSWLEEWAVPILEYKIASDQVFRARYAREIQLLQAFRRSPAAVGALYWKYKKDAYAEYRGLGWPVLRIPYEELVTSPEPVLRRALSFLGLSWHPDVLRHHSLLHTEASGEVTVGGTAIRRPVDAASVGRWSGVLDAPQLREIESIGGPGRSPTLSPDLPRGERARLTGNW